MAKVGFTLRLKQRHFRTSIVKLWKFIGMKQVIIFSRRPRRARD